MPRPLLVKGNPGSGKTSLDYPVVHKIGLVEVRNVAIAPCPYL
ncbi:MAG: hypothetical protein AAF609_24340 [Cyanobacteria bacterium P01_C01_bin.120]